MKSRGENTGQAKSTNKHFNIRTCAKAENNRGGRNALTESELVAARYHSNCSLSVSHHHSAEWRTRLHRIASFVWNGFTGTAVISAAIICFTTQTRILCILLPASGLFTTWETTNSASSLGMMMILSGKTQGSSTLRPMICRQIQRGWLVHWMRFLSCKFLPLRKKCSMSLKLNDHMPQVSTCCSFCTE